LEIIGVLFYFLICLFLLKKWSFFKNSGIPFKTLTFLFSLKFIVGMSVFYVYTYYYTDRKTADVFKYFDDAKYLYEHVYTNSPIKFWKIIFGFQNTTFEIHKHLIETHYWFKPHATNVFNDNRTVIRFNAVIYLFSFGFYHVHTLVLSMLSFIGLTGIYRSFSTVFQNKKNELIVSCFLIPSVLFWGSGILKESILLFGIGVFFYSFTFVLNSEKKPIYFLSALFSLGLLAITKTYVLIVIIPSIISWITVQHFKIKKIGLAFFVINIGLIIGAFNLKYVHPSLDVRGNLKYKQRDFINVARDTKAGSTISIGKLDDSAYSYIKNIPNSLINGLFRPTIIDISNVFSLLSAIENILILFLFVLPMFFFQKPSKIQLPYIYFSIYFSVLLTILIGLTVPVLGAIVRYKVPFMPFIISALLICTDFQKMKNFFNSMIK
jgi:hypothetical protein